MHQPRRPMAASQIPAPFLKRAFFPCWSPWNAKFIWMRASVMSAARPINLSVLLMGSGRPAGRKVRRTFHSMGKNSSFRSHFGPENKRAFTPLQYPRIEWLEEEEERQSGWRNGVRKLLRECYIVLIKISASERKTNRLIGVRRNGG